eukprot:1971899-Lingulodinium_polyedra.AAC.1
MHFATSSYSTVRRARPRHARHQAARAWCHVGYNVSQHSARKVRARSYVAVLTAARSRVRPT